MSFNSAYKKNSVAILALLFAFASPLAFSQEEPESEIDILSLEEQVESTENTVLAQQREFIYIDNFHTYDLNPHTASYASESQILTALYEGLFSYNPSTLVPVPGICIDYKISSNKKKWTFTLRDDARFSNGDPINADTIKYSWLKLLSTEDAPFASLLDCIEGAEQYRNKTGSAENVKIEVRNETTLVVRLKEPCPYLSQILCHNAFCAVSEKPGVYSGAFQLGLQTQDSLTLERNENYWGAGSVYIPSIKIILSDDEEDTIYRFNNGQADWIPGNSKFEKLLNKDNSHYCFTFGTTYLFFKQNNSPWDKKEFREALLTAVPYDKLREKYVAKAQSLIPRFNMLYPEVKGLNDYDEEEALDLMEQARDKYGIPRNEMIPLVFACTSDQYFIEWAELLADAWKPLGVEVMIQTTVPYRYNSSIPGWNADLFMYSWIGDFADPMAFLELFKKDSSLNVAGYSNAEYEQKLTEAAVIDDDYQRFTVLAKAEEILLKDYEIIPVHHGVSLQTINLDSVGGWYQNGIDIHPFKYLYFKKTNPKLPNLVRLN